MIGQGVRFNAMKSKVGNYFSTPIWQFRLKHTACGGWIEFRTDPKNSEYTVVEGAHRRDVGTDAQIANRIGGILIGNDEAKDQARQDAFATFEGKKETQKRSEVEANRIEQLRSRRQRDWSDIDGANRKLRASFRVGRKAREKNVKEMEGLQKTMGFELDLLEGDENYGSFTQMIDYEDPARLDGPHHTSRAMLDLTTFAPGSSNSGSNVIRKSLRQTLSQNSRTAADPFTITRKMSPASHLTSGVKRTRIRESARAEAAGNSSQRRENTFNELSMQPDGAITGSLVEYDSN